MSFRGRQKHDLASLRRRDLVRLFRLRLGPGPNKLQLEEAIWNAVGADYVNISAEKLGQIVNLTLAERVRLDIRTFQASDVTKAEADAYYRDRRRERDRTRPPRRRRKSMIQLKMQRQTSRVQIALREINQTNPTHWSTVEEITDAVNGARVFKGLKPDSVRKIIHRTIDVLEDKGCVETDTGIGKRSLSLRLVRWKS
jgi:hypothetical protein